MNRRALAAFPILLACAAGVMCGRAALHSVPMRDAIGVLFGRGRLLALAGGRGTYEADLERARTERRDRGDNAFAETAGRLASGEDRQSAEHSLLEDIVSAEMAQSLAAHERISAVEVAHELDLLRWQFADERTWRAALRRSHLRLRRLQNDVAAQLRARPWLRRQAGALHGTAAEYRDFYDTHRDRFLQPERYRASHLFLAAPPETPLQVVDVKQKTIAALWERVHKGEDFFELVAANSEDEASNARGGDLGFFSESRMLPDFCAAVRKLRVGEISQPVRTRLGFHIIQLTDVKPARQMTFEEAQPEIALAFENSKLAAAMRNLRGQLLERAEFMRVSLP
jgi:parvulin-like peptidyl-prolyl isomerase